MYSAQILNKFKEGSSSKRHCHAALLLQLAASSRGEPEDAWQIDCNVTLEHLLK